MYRNYNCNYSSFCTSNEEDKYESSCPCAQNESNMFPDECMCGYNSFNQFPENPILGQSYVPFQTLQKTFKPCVGLKMGTIFPDLVSPYMPGQSLAEINYLAMTNEIKEGCNQ